jgi:hypothetical protein
MYFLYGGWYFTYIYVIYRNNKIHKSTFLRNSINLRILGDYIILRKNICKKNNIGSLYKDDRQRDTMGQRDDGHDRALGGRLSQRLSQRL